MCSICGGTQFDQIASAIWQSSADRGRDAHGIEITPNNGAWLGNHRATPTTEVIVPVETQPVGESVKLVFNGIISNDSDLGLREGEADTSVLPRVLDFSNLKSFRDSLHEKIIGSYAIAVLLPDRSIWLACNYKPIWILEHKGHFYFSSLKQHFKVGTPYKMDPYSVRELTSPSSSLSIPRKQYEKALVICSAGLDSTAVAAYACKQHGAHNVRLIHFDYDCLATSKEKTCLIDIAKNLKCEFEILKMPSFGGSSLLGTEGDISEGVGGAEYAHEWVPARNLIMLSLTTGYAEAKKYGHIYLGTNLEEAGAYPDNEEQFILDFSSILYGAVQNGIKIEIHSPLGSLMKHEIVTFGQKYNAPFHLTWSCYRGGEKHCGHCGPCFMRKTAFARNNLVDPVFNK